MKNKKQKVDLIDEEESIEDILKVESTIYLELLQLKDKKWSAKFLIGAILPKSYHRYQMTLVLNEEPYLERIEELEKDPDETALKPMTGKVDLAQADIAITNVIANILASKFADVGNSKSTDGARGALLGLGIVEAGGARPPVAKEAES